MHLTQTQPRASELLLNDLQTIIGALPRECLYTLADKMRSTAAISLMLMAEMQLSDADEPTPAEREQIEYEPLEEISERHNPFRLPGEVEDIEPLDMF